MTEDIHPIAGLTDAALASMLKRAMFVTLMLGAIAGGILWIASGWRDASMIAVGAVISSASILEWQRLIKLFNAKLDRQQTPRGAALVISLFLLRIVIFAAVIYGSLKCLRGSAIALLCGLALAVLAMGWEALRLLRD
ncbi:MAG TPA: hypothetical protein VGL22_05750 [Terracidiphilus sp.]|jgi:hypothetical protein